MKTKRYFSASVVFAVILCVPVLGNIQVLKSGERQQTRRPWGVLANLDTIDSVDMTVLCPDPNKDAKFWKNLHGKVVSRLPANIRMQPTFRSSLDRIYRIRIEILGLEGSPNYVARVQSSFIRSGPLDVSHTSWALAAEVWATAPIMQVVPMQDTPDTVSRWVIEQLDEFISDYHKANPPGTHVNDINVVSVTAATKRAWPAEQRRPAEYKFVASKNSDVFHRPHCIWAERIKPANLVGYSSRAEALKAGKRPCKRCKP